MKDHAEVHGLECTKENTIKFMQSIADMPNRPNVKWFDNGTYQGQTERGYTAVHIYDLDKQVIAVFKKETGNFVTTCQLTTDEHNALMKTGNFGGEKGWYNDLSKYTKEDLCEYCLFI